MPAADLGKRAGVLDKLAETWRAPHSKPQARQLVKAPEPYRSLDRPSWSLAGLLRPHSEGKTILLERSVPLEKLPLSRFLRGS